MERDGWQCYAYEEVESTNTLAVEYSHRAKKGERFVISAENQTKGRGRFDRKWYSCAGNLYFSQGLEVPIKQLGQIIFVSSLSLAQTVKSCEQQANVQIKWPNDILLDGGKLSGTLLEKGEGDYLIIGIGVNIAAVPENNSLLYRPASLAAAGIQITPAAFLKKYLQIFDKNYEQLQHAEFEKLREAWLSFAKGVGEEINIRDINGEKKGVFIGVDENGLLLLKTCDNIEKVYAGDVFFPKSEGK